MAATNDTSSTAPKTQQPLCDMPGCGMPATGSVSDINHCDHHRGFPVSNEGKILQAIRAIRKGGA